MGQQLIYAKFVKRLLDLLLGLIAAVPLLIVMPGIALAIRIESPGPVIFRQKRVGKSGRVFVMYKFRSMVDNAVSKGAGYYFEKDDPRITKVGAFLRKTSLDELPQIFNIIKGDMSIVGPRPMLPFIVEKYYSHYQPILTVKPGLTGLAQVSGRTTLKRSQMIELDKQYIQKITFWKDFTIVCKTFISFLSDHSDVKMDVSEEFLEDLQPDKVRFSLQM